MAWLTSPIFKPGDADADIAAIALGGGRSSRLYKKLVYEKQIAQDVIGAAVLAARSARCSRSRRRRGPDTPPRSWRRRSTRSWRASASPVPTPTEVERARNVIETRMVQGLETLGGFGGVANRLNSYNHFLGDPGYLRRTSSATAT